jgi:signal transduction histidine kinase
MNWRSIRWAIVASMMLVTFVTVLTVGLLTQALVGREIAARERDVLRSNAEAVARQALPLLGAGTPADLGDLADAAAFLTETRVVIADDRRSVLADTGPLVPVDEFVWLGDGRETLPAASRIALGGLGTGRLVLMRLDGSEVAVPGDLRALAARAESNGGTPANVAVVRRVVGPFGSRVDFSVWPDLAEFTTDILPLGVVSGSVGAVVAGAAGMPALPGVTGTRAVTVTTAVSMPTMTIATGWEMPAGITVPIGDPVDPTGFVTLVGGADFGRAALAAARRALAIATALATVVAAGVGLVLSRGLTAPLGNLSAAAERMGGGDLSARAPLTGAGEIGQVGREFNRMADRLAASFADLAAERDALRRFVSDASHELRTPIAALANFTELLQGPAGAEPATRDEFLDESAAQVERLGWITAHLLDLSRIEMGLVALDRAPHGAGDLVEGSVLPHRLAADARGIALVIDGSMPGETVCCDGRRLEMALGNLVDNAVKFTPEGGTVTVGAEATGAAVRFWVADTGPGIDPEETDRLFERFFRGRAAVLTGAPGSGLGLAIVRAVARAHGGRAWAEAREGGGSRFVVEVPRCETGSD